MILYEMRCDVVMMLYNEQELTEQLRQSGLDWCKPTLQPPLTHSMHTHCTKHTPLIFCVMHMYSLNLLYSVRVLHAFYIVYRFCMHFAHIHCFVHPIVSYFIMWLHAELESVHQQLHSKTEAVPRCVPSYMATGFPVLNWNKWSHTYLLLCRTHCKDVIE